MNKLDKIHEHMTGEPSADKATHICIGCGEIPSKCTCDPSGGQEYETDRAFRQQIKDKLKIIQDDISSIRVMVEEIYGHLP